MEYPTQITVNEELVIFKRDWTKKERERFERIFCACLSNPNFGNFEINKVHQYAFAQMLHLDDFYKQTQTTDNE